MTNNTYLYNFILTSYLLNYDKEYGPVLGLDSSIALYIFNYSKDLFFNYHIFFESCSIVSDSHLFSNISYSLIHNFKQVTNIEYHNNLTFQYLDKFNFTIYNLDSYQYSILYKNNEPQSLCYNGLKFTIPSIECIIAYCISQYENDNTIDQLKNIILLSGIYQRKLLYNKVLINLLKLNVNLNKTIKTKLVKDINKLPENSIQHCPLQYNIMKSRTLELLEFCYG